MEWDGGLSKGGQGHTYLQGRNPEAHSTLTVLQKQSALYRPGCCLYKSRHTWPLG